MNSTNTRERLLVTPPNWESRAAMTKGKGESHVRRSARRRPCGPGSARQSASPCSMVGVFGLIAGIVLGQVSVTIIGAMMFLFGDGWMTGSKLLDLDLEHAASA